MTTRILTLIIAVSLVAIGCSSAVKNTDVNVPFSARSYPVEAPAECPVDDVGNTTTGFKRIVAVDEHTVRFDLCAPDPAFLEKISLAPFAINDSGHLITATGDDSINENPVGTGPFYFQNWAHGSQIVLKRFNDYWGVKAKAETLVFNWQQESGGRTIGLKAGTSDFVSGISPDDVAVAASDPDVQTYERPPTTTSYLIMNNSFKPFDDVRVRQAVGMALDHARLTSNFYPTGSLPASYLVPCVIKLGCTGTPWPDRNIAEAKRLLAEAGFPNGLKTTITMADGVRPWIPLPQETATDVQSQLAEIGIDAEIVVLEYTTLKQLRKAGKISGILLDGFNADFLEPSDFLKWLFVDVPSRFGVIDRSISDPINAAVLAAGEKDRERLYGEANDAIRALVPLVPLVQVSSVAASRADVQGLTPSALEYELAAPVSPGSRTSMVWTLADEPQGLWCADNGTIETAKICIQMFEGLYGVSGKSATPQPLLATSCSNSDDGLSWTCTLRSNVRFHNGATLDAGDVLDSFAALWDCASPFHRGTPGVFNYTHVLTPFLHPDACAKPK
jgi:peptide/nickel transport system substrate-binding protein